MAPQASDSATLASLSHSVSEIFDQAQSSAANHRKNCTTLHKLHVRAASVTQAVDNGASLKLTGERCFGDAFLDMVNRILTIKKGPAVADRVVKFIGGYIKYMNEKVSEQKTANPSVASTSSNVDGHDDDTPASRFVARLIKWLLRGFLSKNKTVRFRAVSIVSEMVSHLGEIDEEIYTALRSGLVERARDTESIVRLHAVTALAKLVCSEDPKDLEAGEQSISEIVLDSLCFDPAAEVRKAALLQIPLTYLTLPAILSRGRDVDPVIRKVLYSSVLQIKLGHPKHLTIAQREQVVKNGLGDREDAVRVAARNVVGAWFDGIVSESSGEGTITGGIMRFLRIFDVVGPGEDAAAEALLSVFATRKNVVSEVVFEDSFWNELTPESALLARVFVDHCRSINDEARFDTASLPVVTVFAFHVQEAYNALLELAEENKMLQVADEEDVDEEERDRAEDDMAKAEFVLCELLKVVVHLDYTDEIGRRKVFAVVRDMLSQEELPESLTGLCLDVVKVILPDERELIQVVVEIVHEVRDNDDNAEESTSTHSQDDKTQSDLTQSTIRRDETLERTKQPENMTQEERARADVLDMRCLILYIGMFERVDGDFEENSILEGILGDLIIPAIKRKELAMREKGLVALGLCCLIAKNIAPSSFQLFLNQVQTSSDDLKLKVLQVVFDLMIVYDQEFFGRSEEIAERIITFLLQTLETEQSKAVQAVLCIGISKLLLCGLVTDERVLTSLLMAYVSPVTIDNQELRQCLSYFFPLYCCASLANQSRMQSIFMPTYDLVTRVYDELEEDQEMITPCQFGLLLIDWTNPQKAAEGRSADDSVPESHMNLAVCILRALHEPERADEDRNTLCQLLGHLYIPDHLTSRLLMQLKILLSHLQEYPLDDASSDKMITRFRNQLWKRFSLGAENIHDERYIDDADIRELYQFIGVLVPERKDMASLNTIRDAFSSTVRELQQCGYATAQKLLTVESSNEKKTNSSRPDDHTPSSSPSPKSQKAKINVSASNRPKSVPSSSCAHEDKENAQTALPMIPKERSNPHSSRSTGVLVSPLANKRSRALNPEYTRQVARSTKLFPDRQEPAEGGGNESSEDSRTSTKTRGRTSMPESVLSSNDLTFS